MKALVILAVVIGASAAAHADEPLQADDRGRLGVQLGGSNMLLIDARFRLVPGLFAEAGFLMCCAPGPLHFTAGLVGELPVSPHVSLYAAGGASAQLLFAIDACPDDAPMSCTDLDDAYFLHGRAGVSFGFGKHRVGLDVGVWRGVAHTHGNGEIRQRADFLIPMAGFSYLVAM